MAELKSIMVSEGQELLSDLPVASIRGPKVTFVDGSTCDLVSGDVSLKGSGQVVMRRAGSETKSHLTISQADWISVQSVTVQGSVFISTDTLSRTSTAITREDWFLVRWLKRLMAWIRR
jgi:hypothetical protein